MTCPEFYETDNFRLTIKNFKKCQEHTCVGLTDDITVLDTAEAVQRIRRLNLIAQKSQREKSSEIRLSAFHSTSGTP